MRRARVVILLLGAVVDAASVRAQPMSLRLSPLADTAWLRGAEWDVVPLVTLDSGKTKDTMAVRQVRRAFVLAPGRIVYEAKLTDGGDWAVFSWVDGVTRRLAVSGKEFLEPDGLKKKLFFDRFFFYGGPRWYAAPVAVERRLMLPNAVYLTDGTAWQKLVHSEDTITVSGNRMVVDRASLREVADDGSIFLSMDFKAPAIGGVVRFRDGRFDRMLMSDDSLPGVGKFEAQYTLHQTFGRYSGLRQFERRGETSVAVVRTHEGGRNYVEHVVRQVGTERRSLLKTDTLTMRRATDSVVTAALSPRGDVILQRGAMVSIAGRDGTWRDLLGADKIGQQNFVLGDVTWADDSSSRALLPVWLSQMNGATPLTSFEPMLFYFDGSAVVSLQPGSPRPSTFASLSPRTVSRRVPGYQHGIVVHDRLGFGATSRALILDAGRVALVPAPAFRTRTGDVGVENVIGWNGEREAVIWSGGLFLLRRAQ